jgi:hypothetical protein
MKNYLKEYYIKNKVKLIELAKEYYNIHKKEILENRKKYYKHNKQKIDNYKKQYIKNHKEQEHNYHNDYNKNKRKIDINFKLRDYLRNRLYRALKRNSKSKKIFELLGCSIDFLKLYLGSQFEEGMTWKNYGKWHIDHIKPCASFDLSKLSEQCKCFHYTNLQPLWAEENLSKNDTII